ncbi:ComF family protein, partial [Rhodopseudomonas sp. BR0C11]|nr:ComF family protein [Rhodopseudomonas sp. BR0C11]
MRVGAINRAGVRGLGGFAAAASSLRRIWTRAAQAALDLALPTLCVACREPVAGEGV